MRLCVKQKNKQMMRIVFITLLSILPIMEIYSQETSPAFEMNTRLGRGINMGNAFEAPTETAWSNPWQPDYFRRMAELGFDHVRIPIRWEPAARSMATPPYTIQESFMNRIKEVVDNALENKLHAIINMHHHDQLIADPDGQKERFLVQWSQIAEFFKDYPDSLLFEPLNEPNGPLTPAKWNEFFAGALERIRETNPDRIVVVGTADWGGLSALPQLELPDDPNLILSLHYYQPFTFTHQGAEWVNNSDPWLGTKWHDTEAERETIIGEFAHAINYGKTHNIPIHIGEFGAYSKADIDSRVRWTTFLARWFEEQNFSWAYWEFSAGFGIYNRNTGQYLMPLVNALLHNPMPDPIGIIANNIYTSNFATSNDGWSVNFGGGSSGNLSRTDGKLVVTINNSGTENWHVQLLKPNISLKKDVMYRVTFRASASQNRLTTSYIGQASSPWTSYSGYIGINLTPEEQTYSYTFTMAIDNPSARLVFDLGLNDANFTLSHVTIEEISFATSVPEIRGETLTPYPNPVNNRLYIPDTTGYNEIRIFDTRGSLIKSQSVTQQHLEIDVSQLIPGIYIGTLTGQTHSTSFRFVKR